MEKMRWTKEQYQAITEKGENILVAAAAGSGKTAVLVERIIQKIINDKIDVDKILVVTFTNAAASEMRERILEAIYKKLDENPTDLHLQKQIILLNKANISTIHAFCLEVIKNHFYEIDLSPNFRIGQTAELELFKSDVLDELFEELYEKQDENFLKLVDNYTTYRDDANLKDLVLKTYKYIQSCPFPEEWLEEKVNLFNVDETEDFSNTIWGKILLEEIRENLENFVKELSGIYSKLTKDRQLDKFSKVIADDIDNYNELLYYASKWDSIYETACSIIYEKWPVDRKIDSELKEQAKEVRNKEKDRFKSIKEKILIYNSAEAMRDIKEMYDILKTLKNIVLEFQNRFIKKKREKNCIDFNDIEHNALKILVKKQDGKYVPTPVAEKYREKFIEIAIDEYQDSNLVQEYILSTISKNNNIFMVGDVKQSIYRFRQARPELFLEKYEKYKLVDDKIDNEDAKILLFQNFRSRSNILNITNLVFDTIMSKKLGDIDYTETEYLRQDKDYDSPQAEITNFAGKAELHIIDIANETEDTDDNELIENTELEAKMVAQRMEELLKSNYYVYDKRKRKYRKAEYRDIVILLRATSIAAPVYEKVLTEIGIPVFCDTSSEYLGSIEIQTVLSVLKIIDNPLQDIPLVSTLRSYIGNFSDNDLIKIRLFNREGYFYEALKEAREKADGELKYKVNNFMNFIEKWKREQEYLSLEELIWNIYIDTGYYQYVSLMPDGNLRIANMKMLLERAKQYENASFKGLFNFIHYTEKIKNNNGDMEAAKIIGENENVVRIMSIHKSKGLEFPIVFVCGLGKKFNLKDLNDKMLLHHEIGFGPTYIDTNMGIEYSTLAKEAVRLKLRRESVSEEMRVLYVALTRAREKLILTGIDKNYAKSMENKEQSINILGDINEGIIKQYDSYLDWFELINIARKKEMSLVMDEFTHSKGEIVKNAKSEDLGNKMDFTIFENNKAKTDCDVERILNWEYSYKTSTLIPSKASVTQLKQENKEEMNETKDIDIPTPTFMKDTKKLTGAQRGNAMHLVLQKLNFSTEYNYEEIKELIAKLVAIEILSEKEAETVSINSILKFLKSDIVKEIKKAKEVYKEKPFYLSLTAKEALNVEAEETVLVQGIIDLYFLKENGDIVLLDYKTDYVENDEKELINKYNLQLSLYKRAIEEALNKKVSEVYIYSTYLGKTIKIFNN